MALRDWIGRCEQASRSSVPSRRRGLDVRRPPWSPEWRGWRGISVGCRKPLRKASLLSSQLRLVLAAETDERVPPLPRVGASRGRRSWRRCQPASLPLGNIPRSMKGLPPELPRGPETTTVSSRPSGDATRAVSPHCHSRPLSCQPRGLGRIPRAARPVHLHAVSEADSSLLWNSGEALPCHNPCLGLKAFPLDHHRLPGLPHHRSRRAAQGGNSSGIGTKRGTAVEVRRVETPLWGLLP